ncbi:efflux RND transporter permease subunit [Sulfurospirillum sp. 1612]|uniref:efflux RND transporter permease subunit n=1 Tax=Sulfurospirillum sp. 1612 TaxID=3094835 RepID=UPI002F9328F0
MIRSFYSNVILKFPKIVLFLLAIFTVVFGYFSTKLSIDASADSLLLDNDKDLAFYRAVSERYYMPNFLVITYTPNSPLLSKRSLDTLKQMSEDLKKLPEITSVISMLNVPLLQSPPRPLKELLEKIPTLSDKDVNKTLAKKEFLTSPIYKNNLLSKDFKTTALLINLKPDIKYEDFIKKRNILRAKGDSTALEELNKNFKKYKDLRRNIDHDTIVNIRHIIAKYQNHAKIFLGGVNMIANDMIHFIKNDLMIYGSVLLLLLITTLFIIFKEIKFVLIPVFVSIVSVVFTTGFLGLFGWDVTVISSNYISLQLIITISIILHLIVRYRELANAYDWSQKELLLETVTSKAKPSFYAIITTIAGFGSLILADLKPVINLGYMMSIGVATSLFIAFILFPAAMMLFKRDANAAGQNSIGSGITHFCAALVKNHGNAILISAVVMTLLSLYGATKLKVENSFINYFKQSTQIYQSMKVIDQKLGGTTPLDLIVKFKTEKKPAPSADSFDEFENEFRQSENQNQYWFSPNKMETIRNIQHYLESLKEIGSVQSFGTVLEVAKKLNDNKNLDTFELAVLYKQIPQKFRDIILNPFVNIQDNEVRFAMRVIDSNPDLRRDAFLKKLQKELPKVIDNKEIKFRLTSLMVLYNNMLQSLFESQILTLGAVVIILFLMFILLFRSIKISTIAIISNLIPVSIIFAVMGFSNIPLDVMTITIASISIGIGVDDTIHYIYRFKKEYAKDHDYIQAMERSHNSIGFAMFYTSLAIILGFSILVFSNFIPTIYFGLLTILVMFSALLSALLLLPKLLIKFKAFN